MYVSLITSESKLLLVKFPAIYIFLLKVTNFSLALCLFFFLIAINPWTAFVYVGQYPVT